MRESEDPVTHRITEAMGEWIDAAVDEAAPGENVWWDVFPTPSPQGLLHQIVVWYPGALVGVSNYQGLAVANPAAPNAEASVKEGVKAVIEQLRDRRSQELAEANGHQAVPPGDPGGLIFPGSGL